MWKQLDLWEVRYTESKAVKTLPVDLAPAGWRRDGMSADTAGAVVLVGRFKMLHKQPGAVARAAAVKEKRTWLGSEATVILNFYKKSIPRMGPSEKVTGY